MQWEQLLSLRRHGDNQKRLRTEQDPTRSGFEVDYDRIIFSAAFRNLQDKTQVIPFSKTDFVHTRLTHSLEVEQGLFKTPQANPNKLDRFVKEVEDKLAVTSN